MFKILRRLSARERLSTFELKGRARRRRGIFRILLTTWGCAGRSSTVTGFTMSKDGSRVAV